MTSQVIQSLSANCIGENLWQFIVRNKIDKNRKKVKAKIDKHQVFALKKTKYKGSIILEDDLITFFKKK